VREHYLIHIANVQHDLLLSQVFDILQIVLENSINIESLNGVRG
jgi:hypothetical protein